MHNKKHWTVVETVEGKIMQHVPCPDHDSALLQFLILCQNHVVKNTHEKFNIREALKKNEWVFGQNYVIKMKEM